MSAAARHTPAAGSSGRTARAARERGMTLLEIMVALAVLSMMLVSVWSGLQGTLRGMELTSKIQDRYSGVRNGMSRMVDELGHAYLSFNRPVGETRHFTLFEGRDNGTADSVTFSNFAHLRIRRDADESDQCVIQYFLEEDAEDSSRTHLYRRETRRLTGDRPEDLAQFAPAFVLIEDVVHFDVKYWDATREEWLDDWATMRTDGQADRLPPRIKLEIGVEDGDGEVEYFVTQAKTVLIEKIDLSRTGGR
jgi:general secretion pathway protein J